MDQNKKVEKRIKKVNAFPFEVEFKTPSLSSKAQVVKLSSQGFMMEIEGNYLRPGESLEFNFTLPVLNHVIVSTGTVVKIYTQFPGALTIADRGEALNLIEIHFRGLTLDQKNYVYDFLKKLQTAKAS